MLQHRRSIYVAEIGWFLRLADGLWPNGGLSQWLDRSSPVAGKLARAAAMLQQTPQHGVRGDN
jgi:hypothetical protein